jgi:bla regulator protein blaR1
MKALTTRGKLALLVAALVTVSIPFAIGSVQAQSVHAQSSPPAPAYTYEVVSIHPSKPGQGRTYFRGGTAGGYRTQNTTTMELLTWAYQVHDYQISGAPGWVKDDRFDVSFTPDKTEVSPGPGMEMSKVEAWADRNRQRMQAVLRDRFGLVLRVETHQLPIYALVLVKGGPKLSPPSALPGPYFGLSGPRLTASNAPIKMLMGLLSRELDRPVIDATGLDGTYDFKLEWTPDPILRAPPNEQAIATSGPSIFTALSEQLGLRLESRKGPVPVYVIEKIEKPGDN